MKKLSIFLLISIFIITGVLKCSAMGVSNALKNTSSKPAVILVYAEWAEGYETAVKNFRAVQPKIKNKFNFAELNIADSEAKFFNSKYYIFTNLPYVFMIRGNGRVTKQIPQNCVLSKSCLADKIKTFVP